MELAIMAIQNPIPPIPVPTSKHRQKGEPPLMRSRPAGAEPPRPLPSVTVPEGQRSTRHSPTSGWKRRDQNGVPSGNVLHSYIDSPFL